MKKIKKYEPGLPGITGQRRELESWQIGNNSLVEAVQELQEVLTKHMGNGSVHNHISIPPGEFQYPKEKTYTIADLRSMAKKFYDYWHRKNEELTLKYIPMTTDFLDWLEKENL